MKSIHERIKALIKLAEEQKIYHSFLSINSIIISSILGYSFIFPLNGLYKNDIINLSKLILFKEYFMKLFY